MDMILLDWTRMGRSYCLAGAVAEGGRWRVVRPLLARWRDAPVRNVGWSAYLLDGRLRWEVFELVGPEAARPEPPHVEDLWVRSLRPHRRLAPAGQPPDILSATIAKVSEPIFGAPLGTTQASVYLRPGSGTRSLATVVVPSRGIRFTASQRDGAPEADVRVMLPVPDLAGRLLPVKDHHLLLRADQATASLDGRVKALQFAIGQMGERVAVRLGLSRAFAVGNGAPSCCWVMADGFFSRSDPQP